MERKQPLVGVISILETVLHVSMSCDATILDVRSSSIFSHPINLIHLSCPFMRSFLNVWYFAYPEPQSAPSTTATCLFKVALHNSWQDFLETVFLQETIPKLILTNHNYYHRDHSVHLHSTIRSERLYRLKTFSKCVQSPYFSSAMSFKKKSSP